MDTSKGQGGDLPKVEIVTPEMIHAAMRAMRPHFWEDGKLGVADLRPAIEAALHAGLQVHLASGLQGSKVRD